MEVQGNNNCPAPADPGRPQSLWGAIVVVVGLLAIIGVFAGAMAKFTDAKEIVAVVGSVTGVVGTIVTAYFGIHATANAGTNATNTVANQASTAADKALAFAAHLDPEKAQDLLRQLHITPPPS